jgi:enoyl-CoA hydratase/carnithine racemase
VADVLCEHHDGVALVTLNRPARRNALSLAAGLRIASERAAFADTHARLGVMPGWGMTYALPEAVGPAAADVENRARARWHTAGIDRAEVARRRDGVIERGRSQAGIR